LGYTFFSVDCLMSLYELPHKHQAAHLLGATCSMQIYANMKYNGPRLPDGKRAGFFIGDGALRSMLLLKKH
jgi:hypothetical protein